MITFRKFYFRSMVLLLATEVAIAMFVHDAIVRPYVGDVLVVILIYCFLQSFLRLPVLPTAVAVLCFSFLIELLQYLNIVDVIGLGDSALARTVIGTSFEWIDLLAYILGTLIIIGIETTFGRRRRSKTKEYEILRS